MKRISLVLLVLVLATSLFFSCDQKEEDGDGTGVGVADPADLSGFSGTIPSNDDHIVYVLSELTQDVGSEVEYLYDENEYWDGSAWVANFTDSFSGYYGGTADVSCSGRWAESETASSASYSYRSDTSITLTGLACYYYDAAVTGFAQAAERESASVNTDTGAYNVSCLYEFGFSVSMSGSDCAGKYILFISANGSETGTAYSGDDFWYRVDNMSVTGTGYLKIYDNENQLVREISLSQSQMEMLFPGA